MHWRQCYLLLLLLATDHRLMHRSLCLLLWRHNIDGRLLYEHDRLLDLGRMDTLLQIVHRRIVFAGRTRVGRTCHRHTAHHCIGAAANRMLCLSIGCGR